MSPELAALERALTAYRSRRLPFFQLMRQAAVAAVLREGPAGTELLLIRRAEREGDRWSGHMAFPGGRVSAGEDALAAARRETHEEIGLDLTASARQIGRLSHLLAPAHGRPLPMAVIPFVFALSGDPPLALNAEVAEVVWVPVAFLRERKNRSTMIFRLAALPLKLPCYRYEGRLIWGLTLNMIDELLGRIT